MDKTSALPHVNRARCRLCGLCVTACPCRAIELVGEELVFRCPEECGSEIVCPQGRDCVCICEEACPNDAIECPFEIILDAE